MAAAVLVGVSPFLTDPVDDASIVLGCVLAAVVATAGLRRNRPAYARPWWAIVAGMWLGALDLVLWRSGSADLLHQDRSGATVAAGLVDAVAFGLLFIGLLFLSTSGQRTLRRRALLVDTAIVALAAGFVAWELFGQRVLDENVHALAVCSGLLFIVLSIAIGFAAAPIVRSRSGRPATLWVGASIAFELAGSVAFTVGHAWPDSKVSWPPFLGLALIAGAAAISHPSMRLIGTEPRRVEAPLDARQLAVGGLALLVPATIIGIADLVSDAPIGSPASIAAYLIGMAVLLRSRTRLLVTEGRRSDERFRQYFSLPLIGMMISSPDGRALDVNDRFCRILGRDRDELVGAQLEDFVHPDDIERDRPRLIQLARGELESVVSERRYRRPDGTEVYARCTDHASLDEDGNVEYLLGLVEDVTEAHLADERMNAHLALQDVVLQIAERFVNIDADDVDRTLDEALADLGRQCDVETAVLLERRDDQVRMTHAWRSPSIVADRGSTESIFASLSVLERLGARGAVVIDSIDQLPPQWSAGADLMRVRGVHSLVLLPLVAEDVVLGAIALTRHHAGPPWGSDTIDLLRLAAEVFAQTLIGRRTASALAESEARNRSVVEAAADGIVTIDHRGDIRTFNPAAEILTGWMAAEVVGRPAEILVPESDRDEIREYLGESRAQQQPSDKIEIDGLRRDGRRFPSS